MHRPGGQEASAQGSWSLGARQGLGLSGSLAPAAMQDNYALTFGNSTRKAYWKELERRHQTL